MSSFLKVADLQNQRCTILSVAHVRPDDPQVRIISQEDHINTLMTEEGRIRLFGHSPSQEEVENKAKRWVEQIGIDNRLFFKGTIDELATIAAIRCIDRSGIRFEEVGEILVGSNTGTEYPSVADHVKAALLTHYKTSSPAICADLQEACPSGAVIVRKAWQAIRSGDRKYVLAIAVDLATRLAPFDDQSSNLFSDGAGAMLLGASDKESFIHFDGTCSPEGKNREYIKKTELGFYQEGGEVLKFVMRNVVPAVITQMKELFPRYWRIHFIPHQPSSRLLDPFKEKLKKALPYLKLTLHRDAMNGLLTGNSSSASTIVLLSKLLERKIIKAREIVFIETFGAGLSDAGYSFVVPEHLVRSVA